MATNDTGGARPRTGDLVRRIPHTAHRVIEFVHTIHLPVVCTVRGWAVGLGCNLALAADFTVAAHDAVFWEPFIPAASAPTPARTWLLPRLVGLARAKRMLLLGEKVSARRCRRLGADPPLRSTHRTSTDAAEDLLTRLAAGPTVALGLAKQAIHYGTARHA